MTRPREANKKGIKTAVPMADDMQSSGLKSRHVDAVVEAAIESHSLATRRAYSSAWKRFRHWCTAQGYEALPADPETVAAYLTDRANEGRSISTLKVDRAGIRYYHEGRGLDSPTQSAGVSRVLRGLARRAAASKLVQAHGQTTGLSENDLAAIRASANRRRVHKGGGRETKEVARRRGAVDVALISVMRDALLRRSEAVALTWKDIEFRTDRTARITLRRSKSDQEGAGAVLFAGEAAAKALKKIRPEDRDPAARVFGLRSGRAISNRIRAAAKAAGLEGSWSGHSPRIGMATDLVAAGASLAAIQVAGRWKSARMPAHYARGELAGNGAVARYYQAR